MHHSHTLTEHHQDFLNQNRTDPIIGEKIEEGHTVVLCAACKSAFFIESWEYLGYSHCDQTETLKFLPLPQTLYLKANDKYTQEVLSFGFANTPMFMSNGRGFSLPIFGVSISIIMSGLMMITSETIGFITFLLSMAGCILYGASNSLPKNLNNKSIKQMENMEAKLAMCIDYKLKGLAIENAKTKEAEELFDFEENTRIKAIKEFFIFEDIIEFKYHVIYHPNTDIDALYCQLQIRIKTRSRTKDYFATIHRDTISEWSDFISKLPTDLRIINTPFVYELA